ncbi:MAG: hypothetical protein ACOVP4_12280 [Bacteriovoracaceae bacterium]
MDQISDTKKINYTFSEVCKKSVSHETPLIEFVSPKEIDCMGKKIQVLHFCDKELAADPYFLRGIAEEATRQVICISGKRLIFKYVCAKKSDSVFCDVASLGCLEVKNQLATRLYAIRATITKNEKGQKELNCYFDSSNK